MWTYRGVYVPDQKVRAWIQNNRVKRVLTADEQAAVRAWITLGPDRFRKAHTDPVARRASAWCASYFLALKPVKNATAA